MPSPLQITSLQVRSFRNIEALEVEPGERFNVIAGENGHGKTNVLEAVYVVATSKSFRTSKMQELIAFGADVASVKARVVEGDESRVQSVGLRAGQRVVRIDDKRPPSLAAFAVRTPVVVFHPAEIALSMGPSSERRRLLDRITLFLSPASLDALDSYARALKARQRVLETRGPTARDLSEWEALSAKHGLEVMRQRAKAAERLAVHATAAFSAIAAPELSLSVAYAPSAPGDEAAFVAELESRRAADARRGSAGVGPHRDELALRIDDRSVRGVASQGQHRAVTLALKSAEIEVIGDARGARPILLLDDVSSELDRARTAALFSFLKGQEGQVFLTTTRPELIDTGESAPRSDFVIDRGRLRPSSMVVSR